MKKGIKALHPKIFPITEAIMQNKHFPNFCLALKTFFKDGLQELQLIKIAIFILRYKVIRFLLEQYAW